MNISNQDLSEICAKAVIEHTYKLYGEERPAVHNNIEQIEQEVLEELKKIRTTEQEISFISHDTMCAYEQYFKMHYQVMITITMEQMMDKKFREEEYKDQLRKCRVI